MHLTFLTSSSFNNFFHTELSHSPDMYFGIWHGVKVSLPCLLHTHVWFPQPPSFSILPVHLHRSGCFPQPTRTCYCADTCCRTGRHFTAIKSRACGVVMHHLQLSRRFMAAWPWDLVSPIRASVGSSGEGKWQEYLPLWSTTNIAWGKARAALSDPGSARSSQRVSTVIPSLEKSALNFQKFFLAIPGYFSSSMNLRFILPMTSPLPGSPFSPK